MEKTKSARPAPKMTAHRRRHLRKRTGATLLGAGILLFALVGVGFVLFYTISFGYQFFKAYSNPSEDTTFFQTYIEPVVEQDPQPFSDISKANPDWKLKTAIWSTINKEEGTGRYNYTDDNREIVPKSDILKTYESLFGDRITPTFHSFADNGISYEYSTKAASFYVPIVAMNNIFTAKVTNIARSGNTVTLTVDYIQSSGWTQKPDGTIVAPAPSKTMLYVLTGSNGEYAITAVKALPGSAASAASVSSSAAGASSSDASSAASNSSSS